MAKRGMPKNASGEAVIELKYYILAEIHRIKNERHHFVSFFRSDSTSRI